MKLMIDISKDRYDEIMLMDWKNCRRFFDEEIRAIHDGTLFEECEDAISREAAIDALYALCDTGETLKENPWRDNPHIDAVTETIERLPPVNPQPCEDAISREDTLMALTGEWTEPTDELIHRFIRRIKNLPPVTPQPKTGWIPVSERLPEDIKPVIVTWKNTDPKSYYQYIVGKHFIGTAHYKGGKWFWYSSVTEDLLAEYGRCDSEEFDEAIEVIAWMPLPEPYEPQERNDKE